MKSSRHENSNLIQPIREKLTQIVGESGKTYEEIGSRMGYNPHSAKSLVYRLLRTDRDPQISTLLKFCKAVGVDIKEIFSFHNTSPRAKTKENITIGKGWDSVKKALLRLTEELSRINAEFAESIRRITDS